MTMLKSLYFCNIYMNFFYATMSKLNLSTFYRLLVSTARRKARPEDFAERRT